MAPYPGDQPSPYLPHYPPDLQVEPNSLADFAQKVASDRGALQDAWNNAKAVMDGGPSPNFQGQYARSFHYGNGYPELAHEGDPGIAEGRALYHAYFLTLGAEMKLMEDALLGLETLEQGARMIHNDYAGTDGSSATNLEIGFEDYESSSVLRWLGAPTDPVQEGGNGNG